MEEGLLIRKMAANSRVVRRDVAFYDVRGQLTLVPLWQTTATEGTSQKKHFYSSLRTLFKNLALMSLY